MSEEELPKTVYQAEDLFVDATLGARFMNIETTQHIGGNQTDEDDYFVPRLGLEVVKSGETREGATRFASGAGRHGSFEDFE